jgi:hypothetical protein
MMLLLSRFLIESGLKLCLEKLTISRGPTFNPNKGAWLSKPNIQDTQKYTNYVSFARIFSTILDLPQTCPNPIMSSIKHPQEYQRKINYKFSHHHKIPLNELI